MVENKLSNEKKTEVVIQQVMAERRRLPDTRRSLTHKFAIEGHEGVAEMTVKPTWTGFGLEGLRASLAEVLLPRLAQVDLADTDAVTRCLEGIPGLHAPKALVDNALWDLRAGVAGTPLWRQWHGRARVPVSFTVTRQAPALMAREAAGLVERLGLRMLKIKGGQGVAVDAEALRALRAAVGDGVGFYVDANGAYAPGEARAYAQALFDAGAWAPIILPAEPEVDELHAAPAVEHREVGADKLHGFLNDHRRRLSF